MDSEKSGTALAVPAVPGMPPLIKIWINAMLWKYNISSFAIIYDYKYVSCWANSRATNIKLAMREARRFEVKSHYAL